MAAGHYLRPAPFALYFHILLSQMNDVISCLVDNYWAVVGCWLFTIGARI
jgi:hypothetical protein